MMMRPHELGQIRPGFLADLLLVDGDPLTDITVLQKQDRLLAIIRSSFRGQIFNEFILTTWLGFWGAAVSSEQLRALNKKLYADYRKELESVFKAIGKAQGTQIDAKSAALTITALIDGFWLEWALDHKAFSSKKAEKCCIVTAQMFVKGAEPLQP